MLAFCQHLFCRLSKKSSRLSKKRQKTKLFCYNSSKQNEMYCGIKSKIKIQTEGEKVMKENKIEKILLSIAKVTCASTSCIGLYEPKMPEKLLKKTKRNSK